MTINEPRRLFESNRAPVGLRTLLQRAYEDAPPSTMVDQLVHTVQDRAVTLHRPRTFGRCASWARRTVRHSSRLLLAAAIIGAGSGAWYWAGRNSPGPAPPDSRPAITEAASVIASPAAEAIPPTPLIVPAIEAAPPPTPRIAVPPRARTSLPSRPTRPTRSPPPSVPATTAASPDTVSSPSPSYSEEFRLLRAARQALDKRPEYALALTDEHVHRFAHGMLAQEREAIAIEALAALGKEASARARARTFFAAHPDSPHRSSVERALAHSTERP